MSQGRRQFTDEFKREAVALLVSSGRPLSRIASELGISPSMLRKTGALEAAGEMRGRRGTRYRRRPRIPLRTRRRRFPGFVARTIGCGWSATF
jgi:transposase